MTETVILYDGECPFCTGFAKLVRLRENVGVVRIVNAREGGPELEAVRAAGLDIDEGNAVLEGWDGRAAACIHHGADAQGWLAARSRPLTPVGLFLRALFATPALGRASYPMLRATRNLALRLMGRGGIGAGGGGRDAVRDAGHDAGRYGVPPCG